ncbi:AP4E1 [Auxenochlorella protothecoides x Auxenochlorella symbiontica]
MSALSSTLSTLAKRSLPVTSEFNELVRGIGESKSKGEEDAIVQRMVELCRSKIKSGRRDLRASKDFLIYLIYIDMLGHDTRWGHATVIQLCSEKHLVVKKAAYLAASLLLPPGSELGLMLTATILADLASDNWLVVATALQAACRGATPELVTAFLPSVTALLAHPAPGVARKALLALHRFLQLDPGAGADLERTLVERLGHREPALMAAALAGLGQLIRAEPGQYGALAPYLTAILKQAYEGKLGRAFELHRAPAPFLQMELLRLLRALGEASPSVSGDVRAVVGEAQRRAEALASPLGRAVALECLRTHAALAAPGPDAAAAADAAAALLASPEPNARFAGVDALARLVRVAPDRVAAAQLGVVDCLRGGDETLVHATLGLLFAMADAGNVGVVAREVLAHLRGGRAGAGANAARASVAAQLLALAERAAPGHAWYVRTAAQTLEAAGADAPPGAGDALAAVVAEMGAEGEEELGEAVDELLKRLDGPISRGDAGAGGGDGPGDGDQVSDADPTPVSGGPPVTAPPQLLAAAVWVAGEYGAASSRGLDGALDALCALRETHAPGPRVLAAAAGALGKLGVRRGGALPREGTAFLDRAARSADAALQMRAVQIQRLLASGAEVQCAALPYDAAAAEVEVDPSLPFLNAYVQEAERAGAPPYLSKEDRASLGLGPGGLDGLYHTLPAAQPQGSLNFAAYERAAAPASGRVTGAPDAGGGPAGDAGAAPQASSGGRGAETGPAPAAVGDAARPSPEPAREAPQLLLARGGAGRKWGREAAPTAPPQSRPPPGASPARSGAPPTDRLAQGPSRDAAPPQHQADPARAQLAASLFGGGGAQAGTGAAGAGVGRGVGRSPAAARGARAQPAQAPAAPAPDLLGDLLGEDPVDLGSQQPSGNGHANETDPFFGGGAVGLESVSHQPEREQQQTPLNAPSDPFAMLEGLQTSGQSAPVQDYDPFGGAFLGPTPVASAADGARPPPGLASPSPATSSPNWNLGGVGMRAMAGGAMQKAQSPPPAKKAADPFADLLG